MLFGQRGGLQSAETTEQGSVGEDIRFFPWRCDAIRPGTIATILLLTSQAGGDMQKLMASRSGNRHRVSGFFRRALFGRALDGLVGEGGVHIATPRNGHRPSPLLPFNMCSTASLDIKTAHRAMKSNLRTHALLASDAQANCRCAR